MYYIYGHVKKNGLYKSRSFSGSQYMGLWKSQIHLTVRETSKKHMSYIIYSILNVNINDSKVRKRLNTNMGSILKSTCRSKVAAKQTRTLLKQ